MRVVVPPPPHAMSMEYPFAQYAGRTKTTRSHHGEQGIASLAKLQLLPCQGRSGDRPLPGKLGVGRSGWRGLYYIRTEVSLRLCGTECRWRALSWSRVVCSVELQAFNRRATQRTQAVSSGGTPGGTRRAFVACSKAYAIRSKVGSLHARPVKVAPVGYSGASF